MTCTTCQLIQSQVHRPSDSWQCTVNNFVTITTWVGMTVLWITLTLTNWFFGAYYVYVFCLLGTIKSIYPFLTLLIWCEISSSYFSGCGSFSHWLDPLTPTRWGKLQTVNISKYTHGDLWRRGKKDRKPRQNVCQIKNTMVQVLLHLAKYFHCTMLLENFAAGLTVFCFIQVKWCSMHGQNDSLKYEYCSDYIS